jgi:hypothetical protein
MQIHPVIHISKLRLWRDDKKFPERFVSEALAEEHMDIAQGEVLIDDILDVKIAEHITKPNGDKVLQWLVRWHGFDETADSWEPYKNIKNAIALERFFLGAKWLAMRESDEYREYCKHHRATVPHDQRPTDKRRRTA